MDGWIDNGHNNRLERLFWGAWLMIEKTDKRYRQREGLAWLLHEPNFWWGLILILSHLTLSFYLSLSLSIYISIIYVLYMKVDSLGRPLDSSSSSSSDSSDSDSDFDDKKGVNCSFACLSMTSYCRLLKLFFFITLVHHISAGGNVL